MNTNTKRMGSKEGGGLDNKMQGAQIKAFCFDTLASLFVRTPVNVA